MTDITTLIPREATVVELDNGTVEVHPLKLGDIAKLLSRHRNLAGAFREKEGRADKIAEAIVASGQAAVNGIIAAGIRATVKNVEKADLSAADEIEIIVEIVNATLPTNRARVGKLLAQIGDVLNRLGLSKEETPAA